jgi:protein-S-isoprenylcysteine O-methyltransferase Ste14
MGLRNHLEQSGSWLFKRRSYLPLFVLPIFLICLGSSSYLGHSHAINEIWQKSCMVISFLGLALRINVVGHAPYGTSGRNTRTQVAETLNTTGMYSVVRHPLYLANYLVILGITMEFHIWWLVLLVSCLYALYYERIMMAEEAFLRTRFPTDFEKWAAVTPAFIPKLSGWKPSPVPFCWRTVLQREYNAFFLIIGVFFLLDLIGDSITEGHFKVDPGWFCILVGGFVIFATLRTLKKRTRLLTVEGR